MPAAEGNKDAVPGDVFACTGTGTGTGSSRSDQTSTDEDLPTFTLRPCNLGPALVGRHHFTWVWSRKYQVIVMAIRKVLENLIVAWAHISVQGQLLRNVGRSAYHREGPEPCTAAGDSDLAASTPASFCSSGEREKKADFCDSSQRLGSTRHVRWRTGRTAEGRTYRREHMFVIAKVGEKDGVEDRSCDGRTAVSGHVRWQ